MKTKWSRKYDKCIVCGSTQFKYFGKGKCGHCYLKEYRNKNNDKIKKQKHNWYIKQPKLKNKKCREKLNFDNKRMLALVRDKFTCQKCGAKDNLVVHHIDGNGRNKKIKNNKLNNLITLCTVCHISEHRDLLNRNRKFKMKLRWSIHYGNKCNGCHSRKNPHYGRGYCKKCYYLYITMPKKPKKIKYDWSIKYPACIKCGTTKTRHEGHGLCSKCYYKYRNND